MQSNPINDTLNSFFQHNDLPDIVEAIHSTAGSHISHPENKSRREVADTVFLTNRAAAFLVRLNDVWRRMKPQE